MKKAWVRKAEKEARAAAKAQRAQQKAQRNGHPSAVGAHYAPGNGLAPVQPGHPGCEIDALRLPQFRTSSQPGAALVPYQAPGALVPQAKGPGEDFVAAGNALSGWTWRHRHSLTPIAASGGVIATAGAADPLIATAGLMVVSGAAIFGPETVMGRTWWSKRERKIALAWSVGAGAWSLAAATPLLSLNPSGLGVLAVLTLGQSCAWWFSRRIRPAKEETPMSELSPEALRIAAAWPSDVAHPEKGPKPLHHSHLVRSTLREPNEGTIAFTVELGDDVHNEDALGADLRKTLERRMRVRGNAVRLEADPLDSALLKVTIVHDPEVLKRPAVWEGPVLKETDAGSMIPLAITPDGEDVEIALANESGVEHFGIFGVSGAGKSNTLAAVVLPGIINRRSVMVYVDGGQGTSAAHLAGAADWWAVSGPEEWTSAIHTVYRVMKDRKDRRAAQGLSSWRKGKEQDPEIGLVIDEATTVSGAISKGTESMVLEMLREGRKLGVYVGEAAQNPSGEDLVGGYKAREQMAGNGSLLGHRPGSTVGNTMTGQNASVKVDLRKLPPEPGWIAVIRRGKVLAEEARVRYASEEAVKDMLRFFVPRELTGADARAAGAVYAARRKGADAAAMLRGDIPAAPVESSGEPLTLGASAARSIESPAEKLQRALNTGQKASQKGAELRRGEIVRVLVDHREGLTHGELGKKVNFPASTLSRLLQQLEKRGDVRRAEDGRWQVIVAEEDAA